MIFTALVAPNLSHVSTLQLRVLLLYVSSLSNHGCVYMMTYSSGSFSTCQCALEKNFCLKGPLVGSPGYSADHVGAVLNAATRVKVRTM